MQLKICDQHWVILEKEGNEFSIGNNDGLTFRLVCIYIEIISEDFIPNKSLEQWSLSKINKELRSNLNNL